jgi:DNA invertase Pin-like site-specific DNA recombinase
MLIGYARVSTSEQETAAQVSALKLAGCERIYREKASGGRWERPELHRLLDQLRNNRRRWVWVYPLAFRSSSNTLSFSTACPAEAVAPIILRKCALPCSNFAATQLVPARPPI